MQDDQVSKFISGEQTKDEFVRKTIIPHYDTEFAKKPIFDQPLQSYQGQSYASGDAVTLINKEVEIDSSLSTEKVPNSKLPDFANIQLEEREVPANSKNNVVFFDQDDTHFLSQIKARQEKEQTSKFIQANVRHEMKILGTIFKTYIAIEFDDNLYFIDQHAAHERLLYDKLVQKVDGNSVATQQLLVPYTFTVSSKELESLSQMLGQLRQLGFAIEENGFEISISAVPAILSDISLDSFANEIVKEGLQWDKKRSDFVHDKLCQSACKHAIKAGDSITLDECAYIIEQVRKGVMLCPHGRPITLVISKKEFEKMFKRIV